MTVNLLDLDGESLTAWFAEQGEKPFRAKQVLRWIHRAGVADFDAIAMPCGRAPRGRRIVLATVSVVGLMTLIEPVFLLTTQAVPSGAKASATGWNSTPISATLVRLLVSNTLTESLSGLTTHRRGGPLARRSSAMSLEFTGIAAVVG